MTSFEAASQQRGKRRLSLAVWSVVGASLLALAWTAIQLRVRWAESFEVRTPASALFDQGQPGWLFSYPRDAVGSGIQGVFVADLRIDPVGRVRSLKVLDSPGASITESMSRQLRARTFSPIRDRRGKALVVATKVILYFSIEKGNGIVRTPAEMAAFRRSKRWSSGPLALEPPSGWVGWP